MFANQVIKHLNGNYNNIFNGLLPIIKKAQRFHLGDIWNILQTFEYKKHSRETVFLGENSENVNPPYNVCWVDFFNREHHGWGGKQGILVEKIAENLIKIIFFHHDRATQAWIPSPVVSVYSVGCHIKDNKNFLNFCVSQLNKLPNEKEFIGINLYEYVYHETYKDIDENSRKELSLSNFAGSVCLNLFLMLLNCKNITTEEIIQTGKIKKNKKDKIPKPVISYHILKLELGKNTNGGNCEKGHNPSDTRLHLCRGHFKTFTKDNPLFGHITGRYWWQPQVRGKKEKGIIHKEYNVSIN